jgi:hypothetical protein
MTIQDDLKALYQGTDVEKIDIPERMSKIEKFAVITMYVGVAFWVAFFVWLVIIFNK